MVTQPDGSAAFYHQRFVRIWLMKLTIRGQDATLLYAGGAPDLIMGAIQSELPPENSAAGVVEAINGNI